MATEPYGGVFQVAFHPALKQDLERWLVSRGTMLVRVPQAGDDDLPTYVVQPITLEKRGD